MDETKVKNKAERGGVKSPRANATKPKRETIEPRKANAYKVVKEYAGHNIGDIITRNNESIATKRNVADGYWELIQ